MSDSSDGNGLVIERPREVAKALGISPATFWRRVKNDPDFPQLIRLGTRSVGIIRGEREQYVRKLMAEREQ